METHHTGQAPSLRPQHPIRAKYQVKPYDERVVYEIFKKGTIGGYTIWNPDEKLKSKIVFDGKLQCDYEPGSQSYLQEAKSLNLQGIPTPEGLLTDTGRLSPSQLRSQLQNLPADAITRRDVDGETLIEFAVTTPASQFTSMNNSVPTTHEIPAVYLKMTLNASRDYWPIKTIYEQGAHRTDTTATGWVSGGPIVIPQKIEQTVSRAETDANDKLVYPAVWTVTEIKKCEVQEAEVNSNLPDSLFGSPFPAGAEYYDMRDQENYRVNEVGAPQHWAPRPKGIRGATFAYLTTAVILALIYLFRRTGRHQSLIVQPR